MYPMESLDQCLSNQPEGLQVYASCMELNGENIQFLIRTLHFRKHWNQAFSRPLDLARTRMTLFRAALNIYISLIHQGTATYPINIESNIYQDLEIIFGNATNLVAAQQRTSAQSSPVSQVTPWDEPQEPVTHGHGVGPNAVPMQPMMSTPPIRNSESNDSSELIISFNGTIAHPDPLGGFSVPVAFDVDVFDSAYKSVRYMVWTETWQRYMQWNRAKDDTA